MRFGEDKAVKKKKKKKKRVEFPQNPRGKKFMKKVVRPRHLARFMACDYNYFLCSSNMHAIGLGKCSHCRTNSGSKCEDRLTWATTSESFMLSKQSSCFAGTAKARIIILPQHGTI